MGRRTAILATALASVVAFASVVDATTSPVLSVQAAESRLNQAIAVRRTAEQRVTQLQHTQDELRAQIARASTETEAVTTQLAAAREVARVRAVDAYVNGGTADQLTAFLRSGEIDDASARTAIMSSQAHSAVEAADAFQKLKEENDPKVVALAERLHGVSRELTDAQSDLLQAEAQQADAELGVTAARQAEQRASVARLAAAQPATATGSSARTGGGTVTAADPASGSGLGAAWAALRKCESGGNYQAVSGSGRYRGAYQFDQRTWDSVAATVLPDYIGVDPAAAPPSVQDTMAKTLYAQRGSRPWPHCGSHLP